MQVSLLYLCANIWGGGGALYTKTFTKDSTCRWIYVGNSHSVTEKNLVPFKKLSSVF